MSGWPVLHPFTQHPHILMMVELFLIVDLLALTDM